MARGELYEQESQCYFFFCNLFIFILILLQKVTILKILDLQCLNHLTEKEITILTKHYSE